MKNGSLTVSFIIGHRYGLGVANAIRWLHNNKDLQLNLGVATCLHHKYAVVTGGYSDPRKIFQKYNIPYILFDNVNEDKVECAIRDSKTNIIIVCGLRQIIHDNILEIPANITGNKSLYGKRHGVIGFHPGFLPECAGASPVQWAILSKANYIGLSAFFMDGKGIDSGPIIGSKKINLQKKCDAKKLDNDISICIGELLQTIFIMLDGDITYKEQDINHLKNNNLTKQLRAIDSWLDFCKSSEELVTLVRAFTFPYKMAYFVYNGHVIFVKHALNTEGKMGRIGEILQYSDGKLVVQCDQGIIHLSGLVSDYKPLSFTNGELLN